MAYTDSAIVAGTLTLLGVWVHDPLDPAGTVQTFPYGKAARSRTADTMPAGHFFAGRTYPVVDYGEHENDVFAVTLHVPHGADWFVQLTRLRAFARAKRTLCFRDNRGRKFFGGMDGYRENDEEWGTSVDFSVTRVDFTESVA